MLRRLPSVTHPGLLVGFETRDDAGVFALSEHQALVQTVDFFTPIVDDPYSYGAIAAANALSDIYAMGGKPLTVLNIACFNPTAAPPEVWADILLGAFEKTVEAGAVVMGGHSVEDDQPKFGMAVTGLVDPKKMFTNDTASPGDKIYLSKPLGTGVVTTAAKSDDCTKEELDEAIRWMSTLNKDASERGAAAGVSCATDITGFGLAGHLYNIARASSVHIQIDSASLPILPGVIGMIERGHTTGGARKNAEFIGKALDFQAEISDTMRALVCDPQTSGGLALFSKTPIEGYDCIGEVLRSSEPTISIR
ncbi:MAG: selenide, water dikinase SelD [Fimbriimonadaceae bacterium]|nr:selenide, water dikinase SelD [Fimbriimonadaceae bacterium]